MKRKIKLTESDLHNIIKESVNHILSELDWRTYQSAARKAILNHIIQTYQNQNKNLIKDDVSNLQIKWIRN